MEVESQVVSELRQSTGVYACEEDHTLIRNCFRSINFSRVSKLVYHNDARRVVLDSVEHDLEKV